MATLNISNGTTSVNIPIAYDGLDYSENKVWSSDTGRNNLGTMQGTLIAIKKKISVKMPPITPTKATSINAILSDINNPWLTCTYSFSGVSGSFTAYIGDCSFHWLSEVIGNAGNGLITDCTLSIIEK